MGSAEYILGGGILLMAFSVYSLVSTLLGNTRGKSNSSWIINANPDQSKSGILNMARPLMYSFAMKYALRIENKKYRENIEELLLKAGLSKEINVDEFIGFQIFLGLMLPALMAIMNFTLSMEVPWIAFLILIPLGLQYPPIYARAEKSRRANQCRRDLPFFADLLALTTEAGLDIISSIQRIVEKTPEGNVLAKELEIVLKDIRLGASRSDALKSLARRIDSTEITSFVAVLVDADSTGTSISQVLKDQSMQIRLERFVRAEKAGAKASQFMLIPMIMFIFPAIFLVVFGPIALGMMGKR